jgi:hypothetical protein
LLPGIKTSSFHGAPGRLRAGAGLLAEKLQFPRERDAGAAAVLSEHPTERLGLVLAGFAVLASAMTLFTIIVGSWLCRLANWKGW